MVAFSFYIMDGFCTLNDLLECKSMSVGETIAQIDFLLGLLDK